MAEIVNLRQARKRKKRADKETKPTANRDAHGRPRAEKTRREAERGRLERELDGKKLD